MLNGTDPAERYFGNSRLQYNGNKMDYLEFINCSKAIAACDDILINKHPEWSKKSRVQRRIALDYSNPAEWEAGKLLPNTLDIESAWLGGYNKARALLLRWDCGP